MLSKVYRLPAFQISEVMKHGTRIIGSGITLLLDKNTDSRLRGNDKKVTDNETNVSSTIPRFVPRRELSTGTTLGSPRFAFIVSTKIDKRSTVRNRIRRLMSESVRHLLPTIMKPIDGVFVARKELIGLDQKEVEKRVSEVLKHIA